MTTANSESNTYNFAQNLKEHTRTTGFIPLGGEFLVNTETTDHQLRPSITALADGGYVVTWDSANQDGDSDGVYGQRYDASGAIVGGEFQINTVTESYQSSSSVTSLADGGFVVTWVSNLQDDSNTGVYGQRYDAAGVTVGLEFQINTHTLYDQSAPSVASLADGGFVVTWSSVLQETGHYTDSYGVYAQRYDAAGGTVGIEFLVNTEIVGSQSSSSVTGLADGGFVVTWDSRGQDAPSSIGIYGQLYDVEGDTVGLEFLINTEVVQHQMTPSVASFADGGFIVTWQSADQDGDDFGIFGQRFDALGDANGLEFQINTEVSHGQSAASVTSLADGGFVVTWESELQNNNGSEIYGQRFDAIGDTVGAEFHINTTIEKIQISSAVTALANGGFVVTWESKGQDGGGYGIYAQQFEAQLFGTANDDVITDTVGANWLSGGAGRDKLFGDAGEDTIFGGGSKDKLVGGIGADTLYGNYGNDVLLGSKGGDSLFGNAGNDKLQGGKGQDTLTGGAGADVFVFTKASDSLNSKKADVITDFEFGVDHIDLSAVSGLIFIGSAGFSGVVGELRVGNNGTDSFVRLDIDGDGAADMKVVIEGAVGLTVGDFVL